MTKLSPKVRLRWALNYILLFVIVIIFTYFVGSVLDEILGLKEGTIFIYVFIISLIFLIPYLIYIEIMYRRFSYQLGDKEITIKRGIININHTIIPYERIQNINSEIDLISNLLGIAKIKIETAGSNLEESEIELPGIEKYKEFLNFVMHKVEKSREKTSHLSKENTEKIEEVEKNKERIEKIEENINSIKEMLTSLSHRFVVFETEINQMNDKLERMEKLNSMVSSRISIVEQTNENLNKRMDEVVDFTNTQIDEMRELINKIKETKNRISTSRKRKKSK